MNDPKRRRSIEELRDELQALEHRAELEALADRLMDLRSDIRAAESENLWLRITSSTRSAQPTVSPDPPASDSVESSENASGK